MELKILKIPTALWEVMEVLWRRPGGHAAGNLREEGPYPLGAVLDAGCAGAGSEKPERPDRRETPRWTQAAKRNRRNLNQ